MRLLVENDGSVVLTLEGSLVEGTILGGNSWESTTASKAVSRSKQERSILM
jgi:hypothetical protein